MKRVIETFKKFSATANTAEDTFKEVEKNLRENFGESKAYVDGYAEAKNIYDETMATAKDEALAAIREAFADMTGKVQDFVMQPAPADFVSTLEALKTIGDSVTEQEAALYLAKYKNNYLAHRAVANYLKEQKRYFFRIPAYDEMKADLESLQWQAEKFVREYSRNSYASRLFLDEERTPWKAVADKIAVFLAGDVSAVAEPIENK